MFNKKRKISSTFEEGLITPKQKLENMYKQITKELVVQVTRQSYLKTIYAIHQSAGEDVKKNGTHTMLIDV